MEMQQSECFLVCPFVHVSLQTTLLTLCRASSFILPMAQVPEFPSTRPHTWGDDADGHEQNMLLLMQVQLLQSYLELDERLNQLQVVSSYERKWPDAAGRTKEPPTHFPPSNLDQN